MKLTSQSRKKSLISILSTFCTTIYPILFIYFKNVYEIRERHLIPITLIYICISSIILGLSSFIIKSISKGALITNFILIIIYNFELIASFIGKDDPNYIVAVFISILLIITAFIIYHKLSAQSIFTLNGIWAFTLIILLIMNFIPVAPYMAKKVISHIPSSSVVQPSAQEQSESLPETVTVEAYTGSDSISESDIIDYPNVYLMIFDEYGGSENLEHYYNYDNTSFLKLLSDKGFNISKDSYNYESISTITNIPNLFNLDYVVDHEHESETYLTYLMNPYIYGFFKEKGYDINTSSYPAFLDNTQSTLNYETKELYEDTAGYYILKNSILIHIYNLWISNDTTSNKYATSNNTGIYLTESIEYYKSFSSLDESSPHLNLGYFSCPHIPLCYREDGTPITKQETREDFSSCYIDYLKWTNKRIEEIVNEIIKNDPHSIIIIMSDHGSRSIDLESDNIMNDPDYYKKNILNCVYIDSRTLDISGLSGINTLVTVFNDVYNSNISLKEYK